MQSDEAVLLVEGQPPHTGEFLTMAFSVDRFKHLTVCIDARERVMPLKHSMAIWTQFTKAYAGKVDIISTGLDFAEIAKDELPPAFDNKVILTISKKIFVHLSSIGANVEIVPYAVGYHSSFIRTAYRQGRALDWLITRGVANHVSANRDKKMQVKI